MRARPDLATTAAVLFPADVMRRLTVGDSVRLAAGFKPELGPEANSSALLRQGEVGTIVKDDTHDATDNQPYQVRKSDGETYWYSVADIVAAEPEKMRQPKGAVRLVPAQKQPKEVVAKGATVHVMDERGSVEAECKKIGIWHDESHAFVGRACVVEGLKHHRSTECVKLKCESFGEQWFPKHVLLVPRPAAAADDGREQPVSHSGLTAAQQRALELIAELLFVMTDAVGMDRTLAVCQGIVDDCWGRSLTEHGHYARHVTIKGSLGSGKRTAATMIARTLNLVGAVHSDLVDDYEKFGAGQVPTDGGELDALLRVLYGDMQCKASTHSVLAPAKPRTVVHFRVGEELPPKVMVALSVLLDKMASEGDVAILSGSREHIGKLEAELATFRKRAPLSLELDDLGAEQLAHVTLQLVKQHGYRLERDPTRPVPPTVQSDLDLMTFVVTQTYSAEQLRGANYYLAAELLERAVSNKNKRERSARASALGKGTQGALLGLSVSDFGVEMLTRDQMQLRQRDVDREISEMIGYDKAKAFIAELKAKVECVGAGGDRKKLESCLNCVVTGNPGTGKTTFARLFFKFLRAYGVLQKDVFVEINGLDLKGQYVGSTGPKVQGYFRQAMGGCLFIDEAYAVNDREGGQGGDSFSSEATRTLLTEVENNRTSVLVVLAGYRDKMGRMMRCDEGLARRFPGSLHLDDYSPLEIATIASRYAHSHFDMEVAEGLVEKLAVHVEEQHAVEIAKQNGGLAINLVEKAVNVQSTRLLAEKNSGGDVSDERVLVPADFGIFEKQPEQSVTERAAVDVEIRGMVGMEGAKELFDQVRKQVEFVQQGGKKSVLSRCLNMVITGNPGTGKTTLARLMGKFLHAYGVLPKDTFTERNGLEMKGQYVGHTGPLVKEAVEDAMGGCLFLDEAYALAGDTESLSRDSFASEAIHSLLTLVENNRTNVLVVLAGYRDKMGALLRADPGLPRRFPMRLHLTDYAPSDLALIAEKVAVERFGCQFEAGLGARLATLIEERYAAEISQLNGGLAVNLVEAATARLAERCMDGAIFAGPEAETLTADDFGVDELTADAVKRAAVEAEIEALVGMAEAKTLFNKVRKIAKFVENGGNKAVLSRCLNMVITGNPGTGKTTLARLMGKFLHAYGVLPKDTFTERNALQLKGRYVGHTGPMVREAVQESMGGCLFLDEAYALTGGAGLGDSYGADAVRTLLTEVENARSHVLVILAGYRRPMADFMAADPGLRRRFPLSLDMQDYTPAELAAIAARFAARNGLVFAPDVAVGLEQLIDEQHRGRIHQLNGGLAVNLAEAAMAEMAVRCADAAELEGEALNTLVCADFGMRSKVLDDAMDEFCGGGCSSFVPIVADAKRDGKQRAIDSAAGDVRQFWSTTRAANNNAAGAKVPSSAPRPHQVPDSRPHRDPDSGSQSESGSSSEDSCSHSLTDSPGQSAQRSDGAEQEQLRLQEKVEVKSDEEEDTEIMRKLRECGVCQQGFQWRRCSRPKKPCGRCNQAFVAGYQCAGDNHFICEFCLGRM